MSVFLDDYYDKTETENLLGEKADNVHNHLTSDLTDFESKVGIDLDSLLESLTENIRII